MYLVYSIIWPCGILGCNFYHPIKLYGHIFNILKNGLACHVLVSMILFGSNLNTCAKPEKIRPSRYTTDIIICFLKIKWLKNYSFHVIVIINIAQYQFMTSVTMNTDVPSTIIAHNPVSHNTSSTRHTFSAPSTTSCKYYITTEKVPI
jgi:hypothetical protein